jgi:hypothetical protein
LQCLLDVVPSVGGFGDQVFLGFLVVRDGQFSLHEHSTIKFWEQEA